MRLSISNIAWQPEEDQRIATLLEQHQIDAIDIAPGKYFSSPELATKAEIMAVKQWWHERGISIIGMQSLLFGTTGLNVFGDKASRSGLLTRLQAIFRIAGILGATRLVFGSPRNRDRHSLSDQEATDSAIQFFQQAANYAADEGVLLCLEPNPVCYGANFMTNSQETALVVKAVNHPALRMQLDTGAITINQEDVAQVLNSYAALIGHVHASEPQLVPLGDNGTDHGKMASALAQSLPKAIVTIEMLATETEPALQSISRALHVAIQAYRNPALEQPL
ncbi:MULTISPECIES: sugar phosphate isomerase/epimerase [Alcaligenes]|uniref:sugar phosphate isomerase/epimerase family protein n=1 Tax=Alcaligenes TaxID=507 RepID=UPI000E130264|nr:MULTISPECIES: TIM barrel protein [Alcaligenes]QCP83539.1 sugar phosphate isomerase/epimerase [Alcaligenes faecalis]SSY76744.1 Hydroxypyruvate isomerase [Alcaligenes faecalis subsp. faecalis]